MLVELSVGPAASVGFVVGLAMTALDVTAKISLLNSHDGFIGSPCGTQTARLCRRLPVPLHLPRHRRFAVLFRPTDWRRMMTNERSGIRGRAMSGQPRRLTCAPRAEARPQQQEHARHHQPP